MDYLEILDRSQNGPYLSEENWDLEKVSATTRQIVDKFELSWDKNQIIPDDPGLADRVFNAGFELACLLGLYNRTSERNLNFSRKELEEGLDNSQQALVMGEGSDQRILFPRKIMDDRPPLVWAGNPGAPTPEALFLPTVISCAQEPVVDLITCGSLTYVGGRAVCTFDATEVLATRRELTLMHQALDQVGRSGMGMLAAQSSVSEIGDLAVANPKYLRLTDAHLIPMLNELKLDQRNITRVVNSLEYGMRNAGLHCTLMGGLGGDAPGCAVICVASILLGNLAQKSDYHILHPIHIKHVATTTPAVLWVESIVLQAFARNAPCIIVTDIYPKSGALTRELLWETIANTIVITVSGGHLEGVGSADGLIPNATGLETRLMGEVGHAVAKMGMTMNQANGMVLNLLKKYEHVFNQSGGNPGVRFDLAYDLDTIQPVKEWQEQYEQVGDELSRMGVPVK